MKPERESFAYNVLYSYLSIDPSGWNHDADRFLFSDVLEHTFDDTDELLIDNLYYLVDIDVILNKNRLINKF